MNTPNLNDTLRQVGQRIKTLRMSRGKQQVQVAELCQMEKASLSRIESGKTNVSMSTLLRICDALDVEVKELFNN